MAYTISDLKQDLQGVIHGTSLDKVQNLDGLINRSARKLLADIDPQETRRISQLGSPVYDRVYDYPLPADVKGDRIINVRPQVKATIQNSSFESVTTKDFIGYKNDGSLNIKYNNGFRSLRLSKSGQAAAQISGLDNISDNGTWSVGGDANTLTRDNLQFISGGASLRFDVDGATGNAFIENSTLNPVDITPKDDEGVLFAWMFMPTTPGPVVTDVTLRWGSSTGDYWTQTTTIRQDGLQFETGWNLLKFEWQSATQVGTPDASAIDFLRLEFNYPSGTPIEGYRFDEVTAQLGEILEIEYYSKFLFRDAVTGAFQEDVTDDSNIINLDTDSYNILFNMVAEYTNQQIVGQPANFDIGYFNGQYLDSVARYVRKYPSEAITKTIVYYRMSPRRSSISRRRFNS